MITEEEREKLGLSPDSLKIQNPRTGEWGYRAGVEVFHQLHCLNLLRQALYKDYYGQKDLGGDVGDADSLEDLLGHVGTKPVTYSRCPMHGTDHFCLIDRSLPGGSQIEPHVPWRRDSLHIQAIP